MLNWLARTDWVMVAGIAAIAISAVVVYGRWVYAAVRSVDAERAALPDGGLRRRALFARFTSRGQADFPNRLLSAMRSEFGGHAEKTAGT